MMSVLCEFPHLQLPAQVSNTLWHKGESITAKQYSNFHFLSFLFSRHSTVLPHLSDGIKKINKENKIKLNKK